ncbi:hypothetical protein BPORC_2053 [Bifidobacterium porcinum]|nr:hypothetical protein BPORC_2053 [Bifidobacterium porcinum]
MPETFRQVMYALACVTGRKARRGDGILWYLLICICLGMRSIVSAAYPGCWALVSGARRMSWHTQLTPPWCMTAQFAFAMAGENTEHRFND